MSEGAVVDDVHARDGEDVIDVGGLVRGAHGYVVFGHGDGKVALWQLGPEGHRSGAWVIDNIESCDETSARRHLSVVERRVIAGVRGDREQDLHVMRVLARRGGVQLPSPYEESWLDLADASAEVAATRAELADALSAYRAQTRKAAAALTYKSTPPLTSGLQELLALLDAYGLRLPAAPTSAARDALGKAHVVKAAAALWADTESARTRRTYLHDAGGATARPVAPSWMQHHASVYSCLILS